MMWHITSDNACALNIMHFIVPPPSWGGCVKRWCPSFVCPSVCLSRTWPLSRERKELKTDGKDEPGWTVIPFRGRKVKGQGNKVTSKNSFRFEARPTAAGVRSDANSWWRHLTNRYTNVGVKCQKINLIHSKNTYTCIFPSKIKDLLF